MRRIVFVMLFAASASVCQTPAKQPDTLQALLTEVHQLRQDIEAVTIASQRVQIALYSLQMQDAAVACAAQRVDDAHNKCAGVIANRDHLASDIQRAETALASGRLPPEEAKAGQSQLARIRTEVETQTVAVQSCQATEADAASQLRTDQAKLTELQDRIDRLDQTLEKLGAGQK